MTESIGETTANLRSIARWMDAVPEHKLIGGMVLNFSEASKHVAMAADQIERLNGTTDCDHPQINKATSRWNICPDCGQTWPSGLSG